jgi:copper homeostasis protein
MPASGINENNVEDLVRFTKVREIHSSARARKQSRMQFKNDHIIMGDNYGDEYAFEQTDPDRVRHILKNANFEEYTL